MIMFNSRFLQISVTALTGLLLLGASGCSNLPGTPKQQGAVVGGLGGAAAGAALGGSKHQVLGALLGGALGAGGGYIVGANKDKIMGRDTNDAEQATQSAQTRPATAQEALNSPTADINHDGYVTMDEVIAMKSAGVSDQVMLQRLSATGQVFELTPEQQQYLLNHGVDQYVVNQMQDVNRETRNQLLNQSISRPPVQP